MLENTTFLECNLFKSVAKDKSMVNTKSRNTGNDRLRNNVGRVIQTTNTNFQDCCGYIQRDKRVQCKDRHKAEINRAQRRCLQLPRRVLTQAFPYFPEETRKVFLAQGCTVDADALAHRYKMGRCVQT